MRNARLLAALLLVTACISCGDGSGSGGTGGGSAKGGAGGTGTGGTGGSGTAGTSGGTAGANGGRGGTSAGGGTGGSAAGTAGSAGTAGNGGTNGTAGNGGSGGTTGAGGTAGTGGRGGAGGTTGSGGATAGAGGRGGAGGSAGGAGGRGGAGGSAGGAGGRGGAGGSVGGAGGVAGSAGRGGTSAAGTGGTSVTDGGTDGAAAFNPCPTTTGTACIIMPLGDSITDGVGSSGGGYRVPLFQTAVTNMDLITFVGRNVNGPTMVAGRTFPRGHEGYSGYTIDPDTRDGRSGISPLVDAAISMFHPHIVLLQIGTNDVNLSNDLTNAPTRLGALLDRITTDAPNALLVVARLTPTTNDTTNGRVRTYNNAIPGVVATRTAAGKHIVIVDMYAAFTANAAYKTALMNDELHPNDTGYAVMATTWYAAIRNYLPGN